MTLGKSAGLYGGLEYYAKNGEFGAILGYKTAGSNAQNMRLSYGFKGRGLEGSYSVKGVNAFSYTKEGGLRGNKSFMTEYNMATIKGRQQEMRAKEKADTIKESIMQNPNLLKALGLNEDKLATMSPEELDNTLEKLGKAGKTEAGRKTLLNAGVNLNESSREGFFSQAWGDITDGFNATFGNNASGQHAFVDAATGEFNVRICFVAGTLVRTKDGYKEIQNIRAGDVVLAWNEKSGELGYQPVKQTFIRKADRIWKLTYEDGTTIETTWSHPFYIDGRGWVMAKDLKVGDRSYTSRSIESSNRVKPLRIAVIEVLKRDETVYNFEVDTDHTYFVTKAEVLVHNSGDGYYRIAKVYTVDKGTTYTHAGRTYTRGTGNVYTCTGGPCAGSGANVERLIFMANGDVMQRYQGEDGKLYNARYNNQGEFQGREAFDDVTAKNMAVLNYNEATRSTYVCTTNCTSVTSGVKYVMGVSQGGPNSFCSAGNRCGTDFDEWSRDAARPGGNLENSRTNYANLGIGTQGRIWLITTRAAQDSNVQQINVGSLNYGGNGSHSYGGAMDIGKVTFSNGTTGKFWLGANNNSVERQGIRNFENALANQQGIKQVWSPWRMRGGMFGNNSWRQNPFMLNQSHVPAGYTASQWSQGRSHRHHLHISAYPNYCRFNGIRSASQCP